MLHVKLQHSLLIADAIKTDSNANPKVAHMRKKMNDLTERRKRTHPEIQSI
jgi:hypothetical protein